MELLQELHTLIVEHVGDGGRRATVADGVAVVVVNEPTPPVVAPVPGPTLAIVARGTMRTVFNGEPYEYGAGKYVIASLDLPSTSQVIQADRDEPLTVFIMDLRPQAIASLLVETDEAGTPPAEREFFVTEATPKLLEPVVRLLRAARCPDDLRVLRGSADETASGSAPAAAMRCIDLGSECGLELAGRMRLETGPSPPLVIVVSVHAEDEYAGMIEESAAAGFLAKTALSGNAVRALLAAANEDHHDSSISGPPET
ncbi:AraC family transcriptional regulator N-terminal domain-containing protein [Streptomyces sp. NPDC013157]|uniref:AraC family transcriptional regulator N-terminal domain-containing protein n=1 Tax=Streptomyces sp. NPDC013157 TaxID=3364861 RepID=UPI00367A1574